MGLQGCESLQLGARHQLYRNASYTRCTSRRVPAMPKPTADWERVGDRFYRKIQLYTDVFDQDLELENFHVVGAPYSGAVGMHPSLPATHTSR